MKLIKINQKIIRMAPFRNIAKLATSLIWNGRPCEAVSASERLLHFFFLCLPFSMNF